MNEPAPADLIAWMESNSRKLMLLEDERDTLRMENEALRQRNEKLERVVAAARAYRDAGLLRPYTPGGRNAAIVDALSDLDKEDA